jgi:VWFA-related protein
MRIPIRRSLICAALGSVIAVAQQEYRLRVTVNLVQVDATVTDSEGNPAPDLKAGDFRVLLDGRQQELKYCNFVRAEELAPATVATATPMDLLAAPAGQPAMPAAPVKREDVRRTIVLFVSDLLTSSESMPGIRAGLKRFVLDQMRPGDLVAIVRSSAGLGALQDFTTDRRMLLAAVDQVRWTSHAVGIGGGAAYETIGAPALGGIGPLDVAQLDKIDSVDRATLATTASLLQVVRGMADLPGRKSVILISDGLRLTSPDEMNPMDGSKDIGTGSFLSPISASMRRVADESVRAGVVLYAIDTRGANSLNAKAADRLKPADPRPGRNTEPIAPNGIDPWAMTQGRRDEYSDNQWGGIFLTAQTGGFMITESNRIDAALERVMADQRGYYLLGFQPPADSMEPDSAGTPDYHRLKIEVLRPGLKVRSHAGFFGIGDEYRAAHPDLMLSKTLDSPFQATDIHVDVDASYLMGKSKYFIRAAVYIDGRDVALKGPPNHRTGVMHLMVRAFNANGGSLEGGIDQVRRVDLDHEGYERALKYGLIYTTLLPASKPGPYQVRVALLDEATSKIGTGGGFVSIPPAKGSGLCLSGVIFQHDLGTDDHIVPAGRASVYSAGQVARFEFQIASSGSKLKVDRLAMRTRIFRDGVEVWQSAETPVETDATKTAGTFAKGALEVPKGLDPGKYMIRVEVSDKDTPGAPSAWQWAKLTLK